MSEHLHVFDNPAAILSHEGFQLARFWMTPTRGLRVAIEGNLLMQEFHEFLSTNGTFALVLAPNDDKAISYVGYEAHTVEKNSDTPRYHFEMVADIAKRTVEWKSVHPVFTSENSGISIEMLSLISAYPLHEKSAEYSEIKFVLNKCIGFLQSFQKPEFQSVINSLY